MILAIDQGTTGTTAILMSISGDLISKTTIDFPQHFPKSGWVEHHPEEILTSVELAVRGVLSESARSAQEIKGIGITNQRETVTLFDGDRALHPFIVWQDRRTSDLCNKLKRSEKTVMRRSGLPLDPYFSGTKIRWLIDKLKVSRTNKKIRFRTIDSFLIHYFTGEDAIEITNASRTSLLHLKKRTWDPELLKIFKVPESFCPRVIPSEGMDFKTRGLDYLPDGIPIMAVLGDQQAALFGQCGFKKGSSKITFGTGSFILVHTGDKPVASKNKMISTIALQMKNGQTTYALEGSAFICGAWIQFMRDQLKFFNKASDSETLAIQTPDPDGVYVIPALSGLGAPFWQPQIRGAIVGLTRGSSKAHVARASLEALAFQNKALIDAMKKDTQMKQLSIRVDGGAVANDLLMQIQADVLGSSVIRPKNLEATGLGVGLLASLSLGYLKISDIQKLWVKEREFKARSKNYKELQKKFVIWSDFIRRLSPGSRSRP